jgi:hypothetical protein
MTLALSALSLALLSRHVQLYDCTGMAINGLQQRKIKQHAFDACDMAGFNLAMHARNTSAHMLL